MSVQRNATFTLLCVLAGLVSAPAFASGGGVIPAPADVPNSLDTRAAGAAVVPEGDASYATTALSRHGGNRGKKNSGQYNHLLFMKTYNNDSRMPAPRARFFGSQCAHDGQRVLFGDDLGYRTLFVVKNHFTTAPHIISSNYVGLAACAPGPVPVFTANHKGKPSVGMSRTVYGLVLPASRYAGESGELPPVAVPHNVPLPAHRFNLVFVIDESDSMGTTFKSGSGDILSRHDVVTKYIRNIIDVYRQYGSVHVAYGAYSGRDTMAFPDVNGGKAVAYRQYSHAYKTRGDDAADDNVNDGVDNGARACPSGALPDGAAGHFDWESTATRWSDGAVANKAALADVSDEGDADALVERIDAIKRCGETPFADGLRYATAVLNDEIVSDDAPRVATTTVVYHLTDGEGGGVDMVGTGRWTQAQQDDAVSAYQSALDDAHAYSFVLRINAIASDGSLSVDNHVPQEVQENFSALLAQLPYDPKTGNLLPVDSGFDVDNVMDTIKASLGTVLDAVLSNNLYDVSQSDSSPGASFQYDNPSTLYSLLPVNFQRAWPLEQQFFGYTTDADGHYTKRLYRGTFSASELQSGDVHIASAPGVFTWVGGNYLRGKIPKPVDVEEQLKPILYQDVFMRYVR